MRMPMGGQHQYRQRSRGVAIGLVLVALVLLGIISLAISYMNKGAFFQEDQATNQMMAATIINDAGKVNSAMAYMATTQNLTYADLTTSGGSYPVFSASIGVLEEPFIPATAFVDSSQSQHWFYRPATVALNNVGATHWEYTLFLVNLKKHVCEQINNYLFNSTTLNQAATGTMAQWENTSAPLDLSADAAIKPSGASTGRAEQCIETTDGYYVYYKVVRQQ